MRSLLWNSQQSIEVVDLLYPFLAVDFFVRTIVFLIERASNLTLCYVRPVISSRQSQTFTFYSYVICINRYNVY